MDFEALCCFWKNPYPAIVPSAGRLLPPPSTCCVFDFICVCCCFGLPSLISVTKGMWTLKHFSFLANPHPAFVPSAGRLLPSPSTCRAFDFLCVWFYFGLPRWISVTKGMWALKLFSLLANPYPAIVPSAGRFLPTPSTCRVFAFICVCLYFGLPSCMSVTKGV